MKLFKRFIGTVPFWAYLLMLVAIFDQCAYFIFTYDANVIGSTLSFSPVLSWSIFIIFILVSLCSFFLIVKKPGNTGVILFFIYLQLFVIIGNAGNLFVLKPLINVANIIFRFASCLLIAIFRYRIWDIEIFIRKALLYLGATLIIIPTYLFLIWIVDRFLIRETNLVRFLILGVSVIIFLILRDRIQRLIDLLFHRETYDSATVVSDFEERLAGIYRFEN